MPLLQEKRENTPTAVNSSSGTPWSKEIAANGRSERSAATRDALPYRRKPSRKSQGHLEREPSEVVEAHKASRHYYEHYLNRIRRVAIVPVGRIRDSYPTVSSIRRSERAHAHGTMDHWGESEKPEIGQKRVIPCRQPQLAGTACRRPATTSRSLRSFQIPVMGTSFK